MEITNNTSYNITLINGKIIKKYETVLLTNINDELMNQLNNLRKNGLIMIN